MIRAKTGLKGLDSAVSESRISTHSWVQDQIHRVARKLARKISYVTGLNTNSLLNDAETLQVGNYVNAGLYKPHYDHRVGKNSSLEMVKLSNRFTYINLRSWYVFFQPEMGDRIATWMFYVSLQNIRILPLISKLVNGCYS